MISPETAKLKIRRPGRGDISLVEQSDFFDAQWYAKTYPDVAETGLSPAQHYLWLGALMLRNPSQKFDSAFYLQDNPDVAEHGLNPLVHFLRFGIGEGRRPASLNALSGQAGFSSSGAPVALIGPAPWLAETRRSAILKALPACDETPADQPGPDVLTLADAILENAPPSRVSVIMPSWNRLQVIGRALDSALNQSLSPMEIILVDDGSTDGTLEWVRATYGAQIESGVLQIIVAPHGGVSAARNTGLRAARGDLIAYLDSDNAWRPDYLKIMCAFLAECDDTMTAYAGLVSHDADSGETRVRSRPYDRQRLIGNNFVDLNVYMHRRCVYDQLGGFDEALKRLVDWDMILRHTKLYEPGFVPFIGVEYFLDTSGLGNITRTVKLETNRDAVMAKLRTERFRRGLEKPRIGYVLWDWPALSQSFVLAELKWLVENGFDVEVFYKIAPDRAANLSFSIRAHQVDDPEALARLLVARDRTLVHAHFAYPHTTLLAWPACQKAGIPFTFFAHAVDIFLKNNVARNRIDEVVRDPLCLRLFVHGDYHRNFLAPQNVPPEKIGYNFQAVELDVFSDVPGKPAPQPGAPMRGVFVGRFVEKKGIETLIEAACLLKDTAVAFDVYGYGPLDGLVRQKAADLGLDNLVFHGPLDGREAVREVLEEADFCIVPSIVADTGDTEGFPTIILEAMAARRPVVATTVSSIPDFLDDGITAVLAEPRAPQALADAVRRLLDMSQERREAMLRDACSFLDRRVGVQRTMETYFDTWYENLLDIVLVTYNTEQYEDSAETLEIIRRIRRHTTTPYTLTVIDNGSDPEFREALAGIARDMPNLRHLPLQDNRFVGPATNLALAASDSVFTVYVCSKEGFVARHGWERPLIQYMRANPEVAMGGSLCHLPRFTLGEELPGHPDFSRFRNQGFAGRNPKRPFLHVQGGLFILRRHVVAHYGGFSEELPQNNTDVEFSYFLESQGVVLGDIPEISAVTVKTLPPLSAEIDEHTAIAHPLTCGSVDALDTMRKRQSTRCNLCQGRDCLQDDGTCGTCASTGIERKIYQALAHDWRAHRGNHALIVGAAPVLGRVLGERMFKVTVIAPDEAPAPQERYALVCLACSEATERAAALQAHLAPGGRMIWPEGQENPPEDLVKTSEDLSLWVSHRNSRVLRNDWRRLCVLDHVAG